MKKRSNGLAVAAMIYAFVCSPVGLIMSIIAKKIKERLLDYGVSEDKVLTIHCPEEIREELLHRYLY